MKDKFKILRCSETLWETIDLLKSDTLLASATLGSVATILETIAENMENEEKDEPNNV